MPTVGATQASASRPAGGVLAGTYPNPSYAGSMVTRTVADGKAARTHTHDAGQVSGTFPATYAPTSTTSTSGALTRADDPRLANARPWDQYSLDAYPVPGQAPTWGGVNYLVDFLPTTRPLSDAGTLQKGGIRLTSHLRGTAEQPKVFWRGPREGVTKVDSDGYIEYNIPNAQLASYLRLVINHIGAGTIPEDPAYSDFTIFTPDYPTAGQTLTIEVTSVLFPQGNNTGGRINLIASRGSELAAEVRFKVPVGKYALATYYYSVTASRWIVIDTAVEA